MPDTLFSHARTEADLTTTYRLPIVVSPRLRRTYATESGLFANIKSWFSSKDSGRLTVDVPVEEKDLVIIGGGVAGYVAAIKAGQEGLKVRRIANQLHRNTNE